MAQESYADFSIIQKYIDQKRHHDKETIKYKDKMEELKFAASIKDPSMQGMGGGLESTVRTPVLNYWNNSWSL